MADTFSLFKRRIAYAIMRNALRAPTDKVILVESSERAIAIALSAVAIGLHAVLFANAGAIWRDEANNAALAAMPWDRLCAALSMDSFPALYPCLVRGWALITSASDQSFRLFGSAAGIGLIWAIWSNRRHCGGRVPLLALALVCLNPTILVWGDSLRAYGLGAALLALCFGLFLQLAEMPTVKVASLATLVSILAVQTLYQNILFIAAFAAAASFVGFKTRRIWTVAAAGTSFAIAGASLLPYVGILARYREAYVVRQGAVSLWQLLGIFGAAIASPYVGAAWVLSFAAILFIAWNPTSRLTDDRNEATHFALAVLALSVPGYLIFLLWMDYSAQSWYFILPMTTAALALEAAFDSGDAKGMWRRTRCLAAATAAVASIPLVCSQVGVRRTNVDGIAALLAAEAAPRDLIVVCPWFEGVSFKRYYHGTAAWTTIPPLEDHDIHRYDLIKRRISESAPLESLFAQVDATLKAGGRVWLAGGLPMGSVGGRGSVAPVPGGPAGWHETAYTEPWGEQFRALVEARGFRFVLVWAGDRTPVNPFEDMKLWRAEARHDS